MNNKHSIYSFDIYDTSITRIYNKPETLFYDVAESFIKSIKQPLSTEIVAEIVHIRNESERKARKSSSKEDITLENIYESLSLPKYIHGKKELLYKIELKYEFYSTRVVVPILCKINKLRSEKCKIIFVSDMYLHYDFVMKLLLFHGLYKKGDSLYLSSDIGLTKKNGTLYQYVIDKEGVSPEEILHHGDNINSDIIIAQRYGLSTCHIDTKNLTHYEKMILHSGIFKQTDLSKIASISKITRINTMGTGTYFESWKKMASNIIAPLIVSYVMWILVTAKRKKIKDLYFVSRDGEVLLEIAKILKKSIYNEVKCHYIFGSRQAWNLPSIYSLDKDNLNFLIVPGHSQNIYDILKKINITSEVIDNLELKNIIESYINNINSIKLDDIIDLLKNELIGKIVLNNAKNSRQLLKKYFNEQKILKNKNIAFVDIGWTLKTKSSLNKALGTNKLPFFYFGVRNKRDRTIDSKQYYSFITEEYENNTEFNNASSIFKAVNLIEQVFLMSNKPPLIAYSDNNGHIDYIFGNIIDHPLMDPYIKTIREAMVNYAKEIIKLDFSFDIETIFKMRNIALINFRNFFNNPDIDILKSLLWVKIGDDQNNSRLLPLIKSITLFDLIILMLQKKKLFKNIKFINNNKPVYYWYSASQKISNKNIMKIKKYLKV